jgi:hypothetical protein
MTNRKLPRRQFLQLAAGAAALPAVTPIARGQGTSGSAAERIIVATNGDAKLRVFVEGTGPAFVLLPGQGRGPRDLETFAKHLAFGGYRVIRPEPRGFGESAAEADDIGRKVGGSLRQAGLRLSVVGGCLPLPGGREADLSLYARGGRQDCASLLDDGMLTLPAQISMHAGTAAAHHAMGARARARSCTAASRCEPAGHARAA